MCGVPTFMPLNIGPERVKMMQAWADYLDELREGGKVLPLARPKKKTV